MKPCRRKIDAQLSLWINGVEYTVDRHNPNPATGCVDLLRLEKLSQASVSHEIHDCSLMHDGTEECTCGDFTFLGAKRNRRCKHLEAIAKFYLFRQEPKA